ncbi:nuclear receptor subfamily 1 group I member 2 [Rhinophrynus dorsalis]
MSRVQKAILLEEEEEEEDSCPSCETVEDDDDGEPKICRACGDRATGYHFNAMTCEGCKGFFRRAMKRNMRLSCPFQNMCVINKNNRRHCQACRLKKCLDIGMKKELIMSDEAVEQRRALIKKKQKIAQSPPTSPASILTLDQQNMISQLVEAQTKIYNFSNFKDFRPVRRARGPIEHMQAISSSVFLMLPNISDLLTYMIRGVITFAKSISCFRSLSIEDQIALLKGCAFELCLVRFNTVFNCETCTWHCGEITYDLDDLSLAGFSSLFLDPMVRFHHMMRRLNLRPEEYALLQAVVLFSPDRPGVNEHQKIAELQEYFALTLKTYIEIQNPPNPGHRCLFAKIMHCVTELRTMDNIHSKQLLQILEIQPDSTPLMMEVFGSLSD